VGISVGMEVGVEAGVAGAQLLNAMLPPKKVKNMLAQHITMFVRIMFAFAITGAPDTC
jgi:hypothetical protein